MIAAIDSFFLSINHAIAFPLLTFICRLITLLGEKGIIFLIPAIVLIIFPKTRKLGVCLFGAIACSFLFSNILLKHIVDRPRPFEHSDTFRMWWQAIGAPAEDGSSFPSGHVTAAAAGCTALCLMKGKKWIKWSVIWVALMMFSRCYLMAHHPTDVFVGLILGVGCGFASFYITKFIFNFLEKNEEKKWASWCLYFQIPVVEHAFEVAGEKLHGIKALALNKLPEAKSPARSPKTVKSSKVAKSSRYIDEYDDDYIEEDDDDEENVFEAPKAKASKSTPKKKASLPKVSFGSPKSTYVGKHEKRN